MSGATSKKKETMLLLNNWLKTWGLIPSSGAKVLKIQRSKMSEYLNPDNPRVLPDYVSAHIETFNRLTTEEAKEVIEQRTGIK